VSVIIYQLKSIVLRFNTKIITLKKLISSVPTFPLSVKDINYIDVNNTTKNLKANLQCAGWVDFFPARIG
jgi:hypothetical protein